MTGVSTIPAHEELALASVQAVMVGVDGAVARTVKFIPYGDPFIGRDGRKWVLRDRAQAEKVVAATCAVLGSCDMMIDYDHQSALAATAGVGGTAKAAGWVKRLRVEDDGIWGDVEWTVAAEQALAAREYRYLSPQFRFAKSTGEVTRLVNAGLTNSPNLELNALAHQQPAASTGVELNMTTIALTVAGLAAALALPVEGLDEAKVINAIGLLKTGKDGSEAALASIRTGLELADDAGAEVVLNAIQAAKAATAPDPTKFVPKAGYDELAGRLVALEEVRVLNAVDQAVAAGKLAPAMKAWAIGLGKKDEAALNSFLESAVPFAGGAQIKGEPQAEKGKLSDEEKAICAMTGVSEVEFLKTRDEEAA